MSLYGSIVVSGNPDAKEFGFRVAKTNEVLPLQSGDLVKVFKSIASGEELTRLVYEPERDPQYYQDYQKGLPKDEWVSFFRLQLPCKLERADGTKIEGKLYPFSEQGMEGRVDWTVFDFKNNSYASTHWLQEGDQLTIYSHITDGNVFWEGRLMFDEKPYETGQTVQVISFGTGESGDTPKLENFTMTPVQERYVRTTVEPGQKRLEDLALYNMPAMLVRQP